MMPGIGSQLPELCSKHERRIKVLSEKELSELEKRAGSIRRFTPEEVMLLLSSCVDPAKGERAYNLLLKEIERCGVHRIKEALKKLSEIGVPEESIIEIKKVVYALTIGVPGYNQINPALEKYYLTKLTKEVIKAKKRTSTEHWDYEKLPVDTFIRQLKLEKEFPISLANINPQLKNLTVGELLDYALKNLLKTAITNEEQMSSLENRKKLTEEEITSLIVTYLTKGKFFERAFILLTKNRKKAIETIRSLRSCLLNEHLHPKEAEDLKNLAGGLEVGIVIQKNEMENLEKKFEKRKIPSEQISEQILRLLLTYMHGGEYSEKALNLLAKKFSENPNHFIKAIEEIKPPGKVKG